VFQCARVCVCVRVHGIVLCLYLQNCANAQARIYAGVCICVFVCVCVSLCLSPSISLRMHVCVCTFAQSSACVCVCHTHTDLTRSRGRILPAHRYFLCCCIPYDTIYITHDTWCQVTHNISDMFCFVRSVPPTITAFMCLLS